MADFFLYNTQQVKRLMQVWDSDNPYAKVRVASNIKQIESSLERYQEMYEDFRPSETFRKNFDANTAAIEQAQRQTEAFFDQAEQATAGDNRFRLNQLWREQSNALARNVVNDLPGNFDNVDVPLQTQPEESQEMLNYRWLGSNQLDQRDKYSKKELAARFGEADEQAVKSKADFVQQRSELLQKQLSASKLKDEKASEGRTRAAEQQQLADNLAKSQQELALQYQQQLAQEQSRLQTQPQSGEGLDRLSLSERPPATGPAAGSGLAYGSGYGGGGGFGGGAFGDFGYGEDDYESRGVANGRVVAGVAMSPDGRRLAAGQPATDAYAVETHLASLDVALPERGVEYMFRTTRGDIEITARAVSQPLLGRLVRLAWIAGALLAIVIAWRLLRRIVPYLAGSLWAAGALILIALISLVFFVLPVLSLLVLIVGIVHLVRLIRARRRRSQPAAA
jgi:hypothetical protein